MKNQSAPTCSSHIASCSSGVAARDRSIMGWPSASSAALMPLSENETLPPQVTLWPGSTSSRASSTASAAVSR